MRSLVILTLALGACGAAPSAAPVLAPRLAAVPAAPAAPDALTVTLAADRRLRVGEDTLTLDQLSSRLAEFARDSVRLDGAGLDVARRPCRLRIDPAARWLHVQWLLTLLAEQKVLHVRFVLGDSGGGEADLAWDLPVDSCIRPPEPRLEILLLRVTVDAGGRVRCGEHESFTEDGFARFVAAQRGRAGLQGLDGLAGEIEAEARAPWAAVAEVFQQLRAGGCERVDFRGAAWPTRDDRARDPLPEAATGRRVGAGGATGCGGYREDGRLVLEQEEEEIPEEEIVEEPIDDR